MLLVHGPVAGWSLVTAWSVIDVQRRWILDDVH